MFVCLVNVLSHETDAWDQRGGYEQKKPKQIRGAGFVSGLVPLRRRFPPQGDIARMNSAASGDIPELLESLASSAPPCGGFDRRDLTMAMTMVRALKQKRPNARHKSLLVGQKAKALPTDGRTDGRTDTRSYLVASSQLKSVHALRRVACKIYDIEGCCSRHSAEREIRFRFRFVLSF